MPILPVVKHTESNEESGQSFAAINSAALSCYKNLGISENWLSGPIKFVNRPNGEDSNGKFDVKSNTIYIYIPQKTHIAVDLLWSLTHELAHRIWHQGLDKSKRDVWFSFFKGLGNPLSPEVIKAQSLAAKNNTHMPFWFWYKKNIGNDFQGFIKYLGTIKYIASELPRDYANTSPEEAWADLLAHIVLGRSRNGFLMRKTGGDIRRFILDLIKENSLNTKVIPLNCGLREGK